MTRGLVILILAIGFCARPAAGQQSAFDIDFEKPPVGTALDGTSIHDDSVQPADFRTPSANGQAMARQASAGHGTIRPFEPAPTAAGGTEDLLKLAGEKIQKIDWRKMLLSLGLVVGGYLILVMSLRWLGKGSTGALPKEVVEVLGMAPLNAKQSLQLVRLGSKLLLLIHGPEGTHSLGEISNPHEVEHLAQVCCHRRGRRGPTAFKKFSESATRESLSPPSLESLLRNLQQTLQRSPSRTEYEA